jgi:hypothetical protein
MVFTETRRGYGLGFIYFLQKRRFFKETTYLLPRIILPAAKSQLGQIQEASNKPMHRGVFGVLFQLLTKH